MQFELAHRSRGVYEHTTITVDAPNPDEAVAQVRASIPENDLVLYVRQAGA